MKFCITFLMMNILQKKKIEATLYSYLFLDYDIIKFNHIWRSIQRAYSCVCVMFCVYVQISFRLQQRILGDRISDLPGIRDVTIFYILCGINCVKSQCRSLGTIMPPGPLFALFIFHEIYML